MEKQEFRISINAPKEKVWQTLWGKTTYPEWTSAFAEGSNVETDDYKKGSKILFLDGEGRGMVSRVDENIPNEFMSFRHLGEIKDGVEDTTSEKVKAWSGATENYRLTEANGKTDLRVDMQLSDEFAEMFKDLVPKALSRLKELSEER
jgi:hypothetical protein